MPGRSPGVALCDHIQMTTRTAQCACGRVQVTIENEPLAVVICHCDFCQKRTGSVFQVCGYFVEDQTVKISGETKIYNGLEIDGIGSALGDGINYHFCTTCGSTVYWTIEGQPVLAIAVGNFVDPDFSPPTMEFYVTRRHRWVPPARAADQFETFPPR
jgi:hypothetical protein